MLQLACVRAPSPHRHPSEPIISPTAARVASAGSDAGDQKPARRFDWTNPIQSSCDQPPASGAAGAESSSGDSITRAARVVAGMRSGFQSCYEDAFRRDPHLSFGTVRLSFRVACDGRIASVHAETQNLSETVVTCMFQSVAHAQFDQPARGQSIVNVPVTFVRRTEDAGAPAPDAG